MPGPFQGISTVSSALRAFQRGLDTVGHNIANVNTPGYTRQITTYKTLSPTTLYTGSGMATLGNGVQIDTIKSARNIMLDMQMSAQRGASGRSAAYADALSQLEGVYGEPSDTGISAALGKLFDSWSALGSNPGEPATRLQVRNAAETLTSRIRSAYGQLESLQETTASSAQEIIGRVDSLSKEIAKLNAEIGKFATSSSPANDLVDQRAMMLDEMSSLIGANWKLQANGSVTVYAGGAILVEAAASRPLPSTIDPTGSTLTDGVISIPIRSGQLAGHMEALTQIDKQKAGLDQLADALRSDLNALHQTGVNKQGNTGISFFDDTTTGARSFSLSADVLASADAIAAGVSGAAGDGGLALSIAERRNQAMGALGGKGSESYFQSAITSLASEAAHAAATYEANEAVGMQIEAQRQAITGVSLDEEMTDMMRLQRSYQAAARALSVFDQITEDLLGIIR